LPEYRRRRVELEGRRSALAEQEARLSGEADRLGDLLGLVASLEAFCERVSSGLGGATFDQGRQLVELLIDRVVVTGAEVEIRYVCPTDRRSEQVRFCHLRSDYFSDPDLIGVGGLQALDQVGVAGEVVAAVGRPPSAYQGLALEAHLGHQAPDSFPVDCPAFAPERGRSPGVAEGRPPGCQPPQGTSQPALVGGRGGVVVDAATGPAGRPADQPGRVLVPQPQDDLPSRLRAGGSKAEAFFATSSSM